MNQEKSILKIILSYRFSKIKKNQQCAFCFKDIAKNTECISIGVIDRLTGKKKRMYLCEDHQDMISNNREDYSNEHQQFLFNERYIQET